jgi:hypothetical protein
MLLKIILMFKNKHFIVLTNHKNIWKIEKNNKISVNFVFNLFCLKVTKKSI